MVSHFIVLSRVDPIRFGASDLAEGNSSHYSVIMAKQCKSESRGREVQSQVGRFLLDREKLDLEFQSVQGWVRGETETSDWEVVMGCI